MTSRHRLPARFALSISLLLGGCATTNISLLEVRDFADQSAKLGVYAELSTRFRDTYAREQLYLPPAAERLGKETDVKRRAVYDDFVSAQKAVVLYLQTLSLLAGDARYDLTDKLDDLGNGIRPTSRADLSRSTCLPTPA